MMRETLFTSRTRPLSGIVIKKLSPYLYRVKNTKAAVMVANHDRLKKCIDRDIPLWLYRYREKFRGPLCPRGRNSILPS